jgi:hypothetical protein
MPIDNHRPQWILFPGQKYYRRIQGDQRGQASKAAKQRQAKLVKTSDAHIGTVHQY